MSNWNPTCFIYQPDETKLFQTAMSISARSDLALAKPANFNPNTFESELTNFLNSQDAKNYAIYELGGQISRQIEEENIPCYAFWKIQEYAFNKFIEYEACEYQAFIQQKDFIENLRKDGNYVMLAVFNKFIEKDQSKWINSFVTVLDYDGNSGNVTFCNPRIEDGDNLQLSLKDFWNYTDAGGGLHCGIYFDPEKIKFSTNYKLNDFEYRDVFNNSDLLSKISSDFENSKITDNDIKSNAIPLSMAGANQNVLLDACSMSDSKNSQMLACKKIIELAGNFISKNLYRDHPTKDADNDLII